MERRVELATVRDWDGIMRSVFTPAFKLRVLEALAREEAITGRTKGEVKDSRFVEKKLVELYPTAAHYVIMQEFTGLRTAECCTRINEARFMLVLQDPDAALALAREYKEWKDKQKEG